MYVCMCVCVCVCACVVCMLYVCCMYVCMYVYVCVYVCILGCWSLCILSHLPSWASWNGYRKHFHISHPPPHPTLHLNKNKTLLTHTPSFLISHPGMITVVNCSTIESWLYWKWSMFLLPLILALPSPGGRRTRTKIRYITAHFKSHDLVGLVTWLHDIIIWRACDLSVIIK